MQAPARGRPNSFSDRSGTAWQTRNDIRGPAHATASANVDGKKARRPDRANPVRLSQRGSGTRNQAQPSDRRGSSAVWFRYAGTRRYNCRSSALYDIQPDEVWCAAGSGVLARGLAQAWPNASRHVVQVGRTLSANDVAGATIYEYPEKFGWATDDKPPFPSDPHYDAKAWEVCLARKGSGRVLFWNVTGPAQP